MRDRKGLYIIQIMDLFELGFIWQVTMCGNCTRIMSLFVTERPIPNPLPPYEFRIYIVVL